MAEEKTPMPGKKKSSAALEMDCRSRIVQAKYGFGRKPGSFGLTAFMGIDSKACLDHDAEFAIASLGDMFTGFLTEGVPSPAGKCSIQDVGDDHNEDRDVTVSTGEKAAYRKKQKQQLEVALGRTGSFERSVRGDTERAIMDSQSSSVCICEKNGAVSSCRVCLQHHVARRLREVGHDAAVCRSKWKSSLDMPEGEHSYIEVIPAGGLNEPTTKRVLVELEFQAEFEMARGSSDYNELVARLPEIFVGKPNCLKEMIKVVCSATKRCMKEKKMHLGPWRRYKYMHANWFSASERIEPPPLPTIHCNSLEQEQKKEFHMSKRISNFVVVGVM